MTIHESFRSCIDEKALYKGKNTYLINPDTDLQIDFANLQNNVERIAKYLFYLGYKKGTSIAFAASNGVDLIQAILGCLYGGFRNVAINLLSGNSIISYVLSNSDCELILCDEANYETISKMVNNLGSGIKILKITDLLNQIDKTDTSDIALLPVSQSDDGLLIYTSGTTGNPKGVVLTQGNLIAGGNNVILSHQLTENDIALCSLPLYHINAFCVSMIACLLSGQPMVVPSKFSTKAFWPTIKRYRCTWFSIVPTHIAYLLHYFSEQEFDKDLSTSIRFGRSASSALPAAIQKAFEDKFRVYIIETMGLSEAAAQILSTPLPPARRKLGSPGIPFGNEVRIADKNFSSLGANEEGEILVRGKNIMKCYYKNPEESTKSFTKDMWFKTGDLGKMDEEGYVFVTGRMKEVIIKGGENVSPREIDEVLYRHCQVIEAAAFACPCNNYGETIEACVVVQAWADKEKTKSELFSLCIDNLGKYKSPDKIHFMDELPKGPSGKIQRLKLYEILSN